MQHLDNSVGGGGGGAKKSSGKDQLTGHFQSFFFSYLQKKKQKNL